MIRKTIGIVCEVCGSYAEKPVNAFNEARKRNTVPRYCSQVCAGEAKHRRDGARYGSWEWQQIEWRIRQDILKNHPVTFFRDMSPEKQEEMRRLYEKQSLKRRAA